MLFSVFMRCELLPSRSLRALLTAVLVFGTAVSPAQTIRINELQSSNGTTLIDDASGTPDWIELFNPGTQSVNLAGYGLSDEATNAFKWVFTNATIAPGGFLLVYASGLDRQPFVVPPIDPASVPGLTVWLRAEAVDDANPAQVRATAQGVFVRHWLDQSGRGLHATQAVETNQPLFIDAAPEFHHRPVVRFDGSNSVLLLPRAPASNHFCVMAVVRPTMPHEIDPPSGGGASGVTGQRYLFGALHGGDLSAGAGLSVGTNGASVYEHGSAYMPALAVGRIAGPGVVAVAMNYSNRQPSLWLQGNLTALGNRSARTNVTAPVEIGAGAYGAFAGDVAEILYFDRALSDAEVAGVQAHFAQKYGLSYPRYYHTSFKMDAQGEALYLTQPDGTPADGAPAIPLPRDISYGRQPDGTGPFYYYERPTPGAANLTRAATTLLNSPEFSLPAGFYTNLLSVAISMPDPTIQIRYTHNGSEPTTNSPIYSRPLTLGSRAGLPNDLSAIPTAGGWLPPLGPVYKINVLRARAFRSNAIPSATRTASYVIDVKGRARYSLPVLSLATDRRSFFDPDTGIYVCGNTPGCNFAQSGDDWERPVHVEMIETNNTVALAQESGVRMHGNTSFGFPIKALRLHPLNQKGGQPFRYRIFPDLPIAEFSRLLLRPSGHDCFLTMMRDGLMQSLVRELGLDLQGYRPAIVFLNGEYWGIHNLQEAFENNYFAQHHPGVDPEAVDYLEGYAPGAFAYEGDSAAFDRLILYLQAHDLRQDTNYAHVQSLMEVENYRDFKIAETFYYRWDIGNQRVWRPRTPDGRLRWILFDCDVGYGGFWSFPTNAPWTFNMLAYNLETNGPWKQYQPYGNDHNAPAITFQLRALMNHPTFKRDFINRCADLMNTTLSTGRMLEFIDRMAGEIAPEMAEHCARWQMPASYPAWSNEVQRLRNFAINRPEYMRRHITNQFGLRGWVNVTLKVADTNTGAIRMNTITLSASTNAPWTGFYFKDNAVTLSAQARPGYRFKNWQGLFGPMATNVTNSMLLNGNLTLTANFESVPDTNPPVPAAFSLASGPYVFSRWDATQAAGTYPPNMVFWQTATNAPPDPGLLTEFTNHWQLSYDRASRSRIVGLGESGVAFLNTSDPQADGGGYLGAAVLALNTLGKTNLHVTWRAGTVVPNSRYYAIRLQYRVGVTGAFTDVLDANGYAVEYVRNARVGHEATLGPVRLPVVLENQAYAQLRWKYYWLSGSSGPRDQLRLDDIMVHSGPVASPALRAYRAEGQGTLRFEFSGWPRLLYTPETSTNLVTWERLAPIAAGADGLLPFDVDPVNRGPMRFYRLMWP